jgi:hypothetical protein
MVENDFGAFSIARQIASKHDEPCATAGPGVLRAPYGMRNSSNAL